MRSLLTLCILAAILFLAGSPVVHADSYAPPTPRTISSPTGTFLVRTLPPVREGKSDKWSKMTAIVYRLNPENQSYREISRFELDQQPGEILINDQGTRIVTFDGYFGMGYGDRVIAVMDGSGKDLKTWKLTGIYSQDRIDRMTMTTSSIIWRSNVFMNRDDSVWITPPGEPFQSREKLPNLKLDLKQLKLEKIQQVKLEGID